MKQKYGLAFLLIWMPMMLSLQPPRVPPNPCPKYFQYYRDPQGKIYGTAVLPYDYSTSLVFSVKTSFLKFFTNSPKLKLELLTKLPELNDGTDNVTYNIFFPFTDVIPKITGLTYNGNTYCVGTDEPVQDSPEGITNVWSELKFKFTRQKPGSYKLETLPDTLENDIPFKRPDQAPTVYPAWTPPKVNPTTPKIPQRHQQPININIEEINGLFKAPDTCGFQDMAQARIYGATNTKLGQYPWLVALFWNRGFNLEYKCSATLISNKHVLTAARCLEYNNNNQVVNIKKILLVMGTDNLDEWINNEAIKRRARQVDVHPLYNKIKESADGDIAIILLDRQVTFTDVLSPVCLWKGDSDLKPLVNTMGVIVGFGQDENSSQEGLTNVLRAKRANMPIVTENECLNSPLGLTPSLSKNTFCTKSGDKKQPTGPCQGDTGAGFFVSMDKAYYLRGIASIIPKKNGKCDFSTGYVAFCDAAKFKDWIECQMNDTCY